MSQLFVWAALVLSAFVNWYPKKIEVPRSPNPEENYDQWRLWAAEYSPWLL
jgi:hypothetical protein